MLWLAHHNPEIDWRTEEVKMTRYSEECGKQWRLKQGKLGCRNRKEEKEKEEAEKKWEKKKGNKEKNHRKKGRQEVRKVAEEQEIWDKGKKAVKSEEETKRLVLERFHK